MTQLRTYSYTIAAEDGDGVFKGQEAVIGLTPQGALLSENIDPESDQRLEADEAMARRYIEALLLSDPSDDSIRDVVVAADRSAVVPGLNLKSSEVATLLETNVFHFEQEIQSIPVFGSNAVVEMGTYDSILKSFDANLASEPNISPLASLSPVAALEALKESPNFKSGAEYSSLPILNWFSHPETETWHLVYLFERVPSSYEDANLETDDTPHLQCCGPSPKQEYFDQMIDAHSGASVYYFSSGPAFVPTLCDGHDENGVIQDFYGQQLNSNTYQLFDPLRNIETIDHGFQDITHRPLSAPIKGSSTHFGAGSPAAVSAHVNATSVFDFVNNVLKRNGIDGKGMKITSLVNCTYSAHGGGKNWLNAVWWNDRMWYGQTQRANGTYESLSNHLDIVAHELTHGITETTSNLVYRDESGALNESFSDIFGVIIANWFPAEPNPIAGWVWELGAGLGTGGLPFRDFSNPPRTGHPDHWNKRKYIGTTTDNGGVHYNSNIHNKAVFNLITATDVAGNPVLNLSEISIFYYMTLRRLNRMAKFTDVLRNLRAVAATYFAGDPVRSSQVRAEITQAYASVGIH